MALAATPLPLAQVLALSLHRMGEGAVWFVIVPYINALVKEAGAPEFQVGMYSAAAEALFMLFECVTAPLTARLSDIWGRKPVLLVGVFLFATLGVVFGCTHHLGILTILCIQGAAGGVGSVLTRTILGELTDKTNIVRAYSIFGPSLALGMSMGGWVGGHLSNPADHFAWFKDSVLFKRFPYLLPNLFIAIFVYLTICYLVIVLKETRKLHNKNDRGVRPASIGYWTLLSQPKIAQLMSYLFTQQLLGFGGDLLMPLVAFTDVSLGGWGLPITTIGTMTSVSAMVQFLFSLFVLPWITEVFSRSNCLRIVIWLNALVFLAFPVISMFAEGRAQGDGLSTFVFWFLFVVSIIVKRVSDLHHSIFDTILPSTIPHRNALPLANSMVITFGGFGRIWGPFLANGLFGNSEGGNPGSWRRDGFWIALFLIGCIPALLSLQRLPFAEVEEHTDKVGLAADEYELLRSGSMDGLDDIDISRTHEKVVA